MTMELSNQNKLSEFYEELKRLNINIVRPDINNCFAEFKSNGKNFYYALGALKNVGYEAISNIVKERDKNGKFKSLKDFIKRINPKDINKLQLEGLVKAGVFDSFYLNRKSLFDSIPKIILKTKNDFENRSLNQNELFSSEDEKNEDILINSEEWSFEEKLSKEFETLGFFISDHPLTQFKNIYQQYKIVNFNQFINDEEVDEFNVAATVLKVQEKKTQKGNSYAIVKFSDLSGVFELFIFSEVFEFNRSILFEGNSLIITIIKNLSDEVNRFKKINVKKIVSIKDMVNKPINEIIFNSKEINSLEKISNLTKEKGNTEVKIIFNDSEKKTIYKLKNTRKIDRKSLESLKNNKILTSIK